MIIEDRAHLKMRQKQSSTKLAKIITGVTDFKAVKDNSRAEGSFEASFDPSFYLLVAGAAFACTITCVAICVVATFRRKVGTVLYKCKYWMELEDIR